MTPKKTTPKKTAPNKTHDSLSPEARTPGKEPIKIYKAGVNAGRDGRSTAAATQS